MNDETGRDATIAIIVAVAENSVIGADGAMPWHLSTDLRRFKQITMGCPVIMGRKTFESIGKPLPGRTSIVVTRKAGYDVPGVVACGSVDEAVSAARTIANRDGVETICVIGGGEIYRQLLPEADVLHVTHVECRPEGDTVFPDIMESEWQAGQIVKVPKGERDSSASRYVVYRRNSSVTR